jgi:hypothetical protein
MAETGFKSSRKMNELYYAVRPPLLKKTEG